MANQNLWCDGSNLNGMFVPVGPAWTEADFYSEIRFAKSDWSNYNETGDYSFDPTKISFTDWNHVTLYRNGVLVWGTEP